jgi:phosphoglycolate phosphatase-like HAD superfamily hydrolase
MIKAVIFDLDNTLTDFVRMKVNAVDAAVDAMVDAGLRFPPQKIKQKIMEVYEAKGIEFQNVFDVPESSPTGERARPRWCSTRTSG